MFSLFQDLQARVSRRRNKRTATVTSKLVPSTWRIWVMGPVSYALKLRTIFQLSPTM